MEDWINLTDVTLFRPYLLRRMVFVLFVMATLLALALVLSSGEPVITPKATLRGTGGPFLRVACSPDGRYIAAGQQDGTVTMWDTASMTGHAIAPRRNVPVHDFSATVLAIAFSPDSRLLAWGGGDKQVSLFDIDKKRVRSVYKHESFVEALAFADSGKALVTATEAGLVRLWDTESGKARIVFEEKKSKYMMRDTPHIASIATKAASKSLAIGIYGSVIFFDGHGEIKEHAAARGYETEIRSLCFSPDGKTIAGIAGPVILWRPESGQETAQLQLKLPGTSLSSIAFSPDGKRLAVGLSGAARHASFLKIWDLAGSRELTCFRCHDDLITQLVWSSHGEIIVTASRDGTVKVWDVARLLKESK